jgi:transposase
MQSEVTVEKLAADNAQLRAELDQWKREAERLAEVLERLKYEAKTPREHVDPNQIQLAFEKLAEALLKVAMPDAQPGSPPSSGDKPARKHTPHGRGILPEHLPVDTILIEPKNLPEGARVIGEDVSWRLGFRRASFRRLKVVRPRFVVPTELAGQCDGDQARLLENTSYSAMPADGAHSAEAVVASAVACESTGVSSDSTPSSHRGETTIVQAAAPLEMVKRGLPTNELLASILTGKFADKLPFNRQQGMTARTGVSVGRTAMCQWTEAVSESARYVVSAMEKDARDNAAVIHTDATGILVQNKERCKRGHFWVYVSDNGHVIFRYTSDASGAEPKKFFTGYRGIVVADATATLDAIIGTDDGPVDRAACWSHTRRYFYKALETDRDLALIGIGLINRIFELDRPWSGLPPSKRLALRQEHSRPVFNALLEWCDQQLLLLAEKKSRLYKALFYFTNNKQELSCFLRDGKVVLTNNVSERELRRLVIGRANWLFVGSDDTAPWTGTITSLIGSCAVNGLDPENYLRDLFRVLPHWPKTRLLELCPRDWATTRARLDPVELALPLGPLTIPAAVR